MNRVRPLIATAAAIAAAVLVYALAPVYRPAGWSSATSGDDVRTDVPAAVRRDSAAAARGAPGSEDDEPLVADARSGADDRQSRAAAVSELVAASPSFRNVTLMLAIHDAGYVCSDVARARNLDVEGAAWRVECVDSLAYSVSVDDKGRLDVAPTMPAFDSPRAVPIPRRLQDQINRQPPPDP